MLDIKYLLANVEAVKQNCRNRNVSTDILNAVDVVVELEQNRKSLLQEVEEIRRLQNANAQATGKEKDPESCQGFIAEGKHLKASIGTKETELKNLDVQLKTELSRIPNLTIPTLPSVAGGGEPGAARSARPGFSTSRPGTMLRSARLLDLIDFESGAEVSGHGFYFLKNDAVLLELALQQFAIQTLVKKGFIPIVTPDLARNQILEGIGFTPRGTETQIYSVEDSDLSLIGTSEITLGGCTPTRSLMRRCFL